MDMSQFLLALVSGGVIATLVDKLCSRIFQKRDRKDETTAALKRLEEKSRQRDITDSKQILLILMNHYPEDKEAIMSEADRYFIQLNGDSWMLNTFVTWAREHDVNVDYILKYHNNRITPIDKNQDQ